MSKCPNCKKECNLDQQYQCRNCGEVFWQSKKLFKKNHEKYLMDRMGIITKEDRKLIKNKHSGEDFFVSVEESIPVEISKLQVPSMDVSFSNIILKAEICKIEELILRENFEAFLIVYLEDTLNDHEDKSQFKYNIFSLVENSNLYCEDEITNYLENLGYKSLIQNLKDSVTGYNEKHLFIRKTREAPVTVEQVKQEKQRFTEYEEMILLARNICIKEEKKNQKY